MTSLYYRMDMTQNLSFTHHQILNSLYFFSQSKLLLIINKQFNYGTFRIVHLQRSILITRWRYADITVFKALTTCVRVYVAVSKPAKPYVSTLRTKNMKYTEARCWKQSFKVIFSWRLTTYVFSFYDTI